MKHAVTPLDFDALLAHQDWLRGLVRTLVRDADQAEDVMQETWLAAVGRPPTGSIRGFLRSVARNIALRRRRREAAREARERAAARPEAGPTTDELVEREATRSALVREVIALSEPYRTAVVLRYFEGLKPPAMARRLGISAEATRRRLKAAEDFLRRRLRARYGERWSTAVLPLLGGGAFGVVTSGGAVATGVKVAAAAAVVGGALLLWRGVGPSPAKHAAEPPVAETPGRSPVARDEGAARSDEPEAGTRAGDLRVDRIDPLGLPLLVHGRVVSREGAPLPGARVRVYRYHETIHAEVACDTEGGYAIHADPLDGSYIQVEAVAPGRGTESRSVPTGTRLHFALGPAGCIEGRVRRPDGTPVGPGVEVTAQSGTRYDARARRATTDESGAFRIHALPPGPYGVSAGTGGSEARRGSLTHVRVAAHRASKLDFVLDAPRLVTVTGRAVVRGTGRPLAGVPLTFHSPLAEVKMTTDADGRFRLERRSAEGTVVPSGLPVVRGKAWVRSEVRRRETPDGFDYRLVFEPGTGVSGVVLDANGRPVVGARYGSGNRSFTAYGNRPTTDAAGRFRLVGAPGKHTLLLRITVAGQFRYHHQRDVVLTAGREQRDLEVRLPAGGAIEGAIRLPDGAPAGGARIEFRTVSGPRSHRGWFRVVADAAGRYRVENLPPAAYRAAIRVDGYPGFRPEAEVDVTARATAVAPDWTLPAGEELAGRVLDRAGRPVIGMLVRVGRPPREGQRRGDYVAFAYSDEGGRFRFHGIPSGEFLVTPLVPESRRGAPVSARAGDENVVLVTRPPVRLIGRVTLADGGRPATRFRVTRVRQAGAGQLQPITARIADPEGRFDLPLPKDGDWGLEVEAQVHGVVHRGQGAIAIRGRRAPPSLVIVLHRALAVTGFVRAPDGTPIPRAVVEMRRPGGSPLSPVFEATSGADGRFTIDAVPPGDYVMDCRHPDRVASRRRVCLLAGGYPVQEFALSATGASVRVTVVEGEGRPVAGARVLVRDPVGELIAPHRSLYERAFFRARRREPALTYEAWHRRVNYTDARGELERRFLPDGTVRVTVEVKGYRSATLPATVRTGTTQALRFVLLRREGAGGETR